MTPGALREATAPLLLLGVIAAGGLLELDVRMAADLAAIESAGEVIASDKDQPLTIVLLGSGIDGVVAAGAAPTVFVVALACLILLELGVAAVVALPVRDEEARPR